MLKGIAQKLEAMLSHPKIFLGHSVVKLVKPKLSCQEVQQKQLRTYLRTLSVDLLLNGPGRELKDRRQEKNEEQDICFALL